LVCKPNNQIVTKSPFNKCPSTDGVQLAIDYLNNTTT